MSDYTNQVNEPGIAILIDCWEHLTDQHKIYPETWNNIITAIENKNIQTVVLSTYTYDIKTHWNSEWFTNAHHIFFNGNPRQEDWVRTLPESIGTAPGYIYQTAKTIFDYEFSNQLKFMLHDSDMLKWYIEEVVPHIKNLWFFGCHWDLCLKERPIGFENLQSWANKTERNCLTDINCVVTEFNERPSVDNFKDWSLINNGVYRLND